MKKITSLFIFFNWFTCFAQDSLETIVSGDICNCFGRTKKMNLAKFEGCFKTAIEKHEDLLNRALKNVNKDSGNAFVLRLSDKIGVSLVYSCDSYFQLMDTLRMPGLHNLNQDSVRRLIRKMDEKAPKEKDIYYYNLRALRYIQVGELDSALHSFDTALSLDKKFYQIVYLRAWILESQNKFDEAIGIYNQLAAQKNRNLYRICAAIATRKKREQ